MSSRSFPLDRTRPRSDPSRFFRPKSFLLDISLPVTTSLIGSLEASFAEALDLTSGFRPVNGGELNDESPTTAQDVRDQRVLNSERRSELLGLQKDIVEQQEALQLVSLAFWRSRLEPVF